MTQRTKHFVLYASLLTATGLGVGAVAYYGELTTFARQDVPSELAYVPSTAAMVAYADVREVMASDLRQKLLGALPEGSREHGRFREETGVDVEHDIDHVVAVLLPREGEHTGFAVLRGRFDQVRLEALTREHGGEVADYKGKRLLRPGFPARDGRPAERRPALVFAEPGLVIVGEESALRQAIDTSQGSASAVSNEELSNLINGVDSAANAWAVGRFDVLLKGAQLPQGVAGRIPPVQWFVASARVDGGITGTVMAEARDEQSARNMLDLVNGVLALARLQAGDRPEVQALVSGLALTGSGKNVQLSFSLPASVVDLLPQMGERRSQP